MKGIPKYVLEGRKARLSTQIETVLKRLGSTSTKLRDHCYDKAEALQLLEQFAHNNRYGVVPDKLVCYRIYIDDDEGNKGELGLTFVPVYRCWEFYFKSLNKHSRQVVEFKQHLKEHGFNLKKI